MKTPSVRFLLVSAVMVLLSACNPQGAEYVDELDLVISLKNDTVNYDDYQTYLLADTIVYISNVDGETMAPADESYILTELNDRMKELGWQEADTNQGPADAVILVSVLQNVNVSIFTGWWDYWYPWGGWGYYPGYSGGWYYPGYPGGYCCYTSVYSYREGTMIIEMLDPNHPVDVEGQVPDKIPLIWASGINGLLEGSKSNIRSRVSDAMDQMFEDSPYLNKN